MARWLIGVRLAGYGAAYFFAAGAFMSYWPVWLRDRGMSDSQIGTVFMSRQLVSVLSTLAIGWAAHRLGNVRGVILVLAGAATFLLTGYQFSYTFLAILAVSLVWGGVWAPTMALYDGILVNETRARGFNYGSLRVWSSVAFILGTVICGVAVDHNGPAWVLYVGFAALTWRAAGIDDVTISLLWAESVAVEIVLMLGSGWLLARLGATGLIGLGLACAMVRWLGMAFTTELWALVLLQALHAGSFAACHLGAMAFIQRALPASGVALGQSVYYALGTGATQAVVFQLAGVLYAAVGQKAFLGMFAVSAIGMAALVTLVRIWKGGLLVREVVSSRA